MAETQNNTPIFLRVISVILFLFGVFAFFGSLFMWGEGFLLSFPEGVDYTFPITDILVNAPASILAAIGLWRLKRYGFVAAYFVAGFYVYASVEIFVHVFQAGPPFATEILVPQILAVMVAITLMIYLWKKQDIFFDEKGKA
ncbi:MAG TPA: hypothetical protein VFQ13_05430 [Anaerolineales bacterium]|nr:hypothetical protein [Anaerolineales bacterium]